MKKKVIVLWLLLLAASSFWACAKEDKTSYDGSGTITYREEDFYPVEIYAADRKMSEVPTISRSNIVGKGSGLGNNILFAGDHAFYYIQCVFEESVETPSSINCYEYDLRNNYSTLLYTASDERCNSKDYCFAMGKLFYVICAQGNVRIEYYDLKTKQRTRIAVFDDGRIPSLTGCGDYVTWYVENENGGISVWGYQTATRKQFLICDDAVAFSPATIPRVSDGSITAYITKHNDRYHINVYDLSSRQTCKTYRLDYDSMVSRVQAASRYLIFTDVTGPETVNCMTKVIDTRTDIAYSLSIEGKNVDVCDFLLQKDALTLLYFGVRDRNGNPESKIYDIDLHELRALVYDADEMYHTLAETDSGYLMALNGRDGSVARIKNGEQFSTGISTLNKDFDRRIIESILVTNMDSNDSILITYRDSESIDKIYDFWSKKVADPYIEADLSNIEERLYVKFTMFDNEELFFSVFRAGEKYFLEQPQYLGNSRGFHYITNSSDIIEITENDYMLFINML